MKKKLCNQLSQYCWPEVGGTSGTCFVSKTKKFPRIHREIVLAVGQMKDQHKVTNSAN